MVVKYDIRKNAYYDSVTLMLISKEIKKMDGVDEVLVGMGTELNKELAENLSLAGADITALSANDFFIAARLENEDIMNSVEHPRIIATWNLDDNQMVVIPI